MANLYAEITCEPNGTMTVAEVYHDRHRNSKKRHVIGHHFDDIRDARRCAVRFGLTKIDETKLGLYANEARGVRPIHVRAHPRRLRAGSTRVTAHQRTANPARHFGTRTITLPRGLSRQDAYRAVPASAGDFRGFQYDPKTGTARIT